MYHEKGLAENLPGLFNIWIWNTAYPVLRNPAEMPLMVAART